MKVHKPKIVAAVIAIAVILGAALFVLRGSDKQSAEATTALRESDDGPDFVHPRDEALWSRHLAAGGELRMKVEQAAPDGADESARWKEVVLESLGPLDAEQEGALRSQSLAMLQRYRKRIEELAPSSASGEPKAYAEISDLYGSEMRSMAEIELLDTQSYWTFAEGSKGPAMVGKLIGGNCGFRSVTPPPVMRHLTIDGQRVQVVFPFSKSRFPIYHEMRQRSLKVSESAALELAREFNALSEERRALFRAILEDPNSLNGRNAAHESFFRRYDLSTLRFDKQDLTMKAM